MRLPFRYMVTSVQIKQLIENSTVLSAAERKEWLDLLPFMNDKQQSELLLILQTNGEQAPTPAAPIPVTESLHSATTVSAMAPPASHEVAAERPLQPEATTVSAFLNKNFASELHRGSMPSFVQSTAIHAVPNSAESLSSGSGLPKVESAVQAPEPKLQQPAIPTASLHNAPVERAVSAQSISSTSVGSKAGGLPVSAAAHAVELFPEAQEPVISARSLESVRMLNVTTLRAKGVMNIETELKVLCEKFGYFSVQFAFEQSPLYQAYVAVGARILKDHQTFEEVQAALASAGRPYLAKPEFEEFSDLLRRLKGHT